MFGMCGGPLKCGAPVRPNMFEHSLIRPELVYVAKQRVQVQLIYVAKGLYGTTEIGVAKVSRMRAANAELAYKLLALNVE